MPGSAWYEDSYSACSLCFHGPQWHNDLGGCTRTIDGWCECSRIYLPSAEGPEAFGVAIDQDEKGVVIRFADRDRPPGGLA